MHDRIQELRKGHLRMSQAAFGARLGVSRDVINNIENNRLAKPEQKLSLIKLICKEFSVNEEWLLTGTGPMFVQPDTFSLDQYLKEKGCTPLELEIVKAYFELDQDTRQKVFDHFQSRLEAAKERLAADSSQLPPEEAVPPELKSPVDMTDAEIDQLAEQMRQEMHREKEAVARSQVIPVSGMISSRPPIGGSGGGATGSATG